MIEYRKSWYTLTSYFVAKTTSDILFQLVNPVLFFTPVYWILGFRHEFTYFILSLLTLEILCLCACSWGYLIACIAPGSDVVNIISPTLLLPFMIAGGFLVNRGSLPQYISWFADLSFFRYAYENLMILEWKDREIKCNNST
jgi:ABC-type multidrug transport system permease subunit